MVGALEGSSTTVDEVGDEYRSMAGVIGQSKKLITKYARREFTDKVLIIFALAFFFAVVLYILRKRVFPSYETLSMILMSLGFPSSNLVPATICQRMLIIGKLNSDPIKMSPLEANTFSSMSAASKWMVSSRLFRPKPKSLSVLNANFLRICQLEPGLGPKPPFENLG